MTYPETIQYLESFINYEKISVYPYSQSLKLERIKEFLLEIGNPEQGLRCIHIAGSKGKGSTCAFCAYILSQAGYKTGLYTSPHLSDFRERIRILKGSSTEDFSGIIPRQRLSDLTQRLKPYIEEYNLNSKYGPLSFFEVYTSIAFVYFKEENVDFAVLETGLGGRLDATNAVESLVCAITPISYEHTQKLGNTLSEIAAEKAGIIKGYQPIVVSAPQEEEAMAVIEEKCRRAGANLFRVGKDIVYERDGGKFSVKGILGQYSDLEIGLLGGHQVMNAATAIGIIEALHFRGINIDRDFLKTGLANARWPGRCEVISKDPLIVLDGAQNVSSSRHLKEAVSENFKYDKLILVLGISDDKDKKGMCSQLYGLADEVVLTKANNPRATEPDELAQHFRDKVIHITQNVQQARELASRIAGRNDLILVCGSLFVVGEFRDDKI